MQKNFASLAYANNNEGKAGRGNNDGVPSLQLKVAAGLADSSCVCRCWVACAAVL